MKLTLKTKRANQESRTPIKLKCDPFWKRFGRNSRKNTFYSLDIRIFYFIYRNWRQLKSINYRGAILNKFEINFDLINLWLSDSSWIVFIRFGTFDFHMDYIPVLCQHAQHVRVRRSYSMSVGAQTTITTTKTAAQMNTVNRLFVVHIKAVMIKYCAVTSILYKCKSDCMRY